MARVLYRSRYKKKYSKGMRQRNVVAYTYRRIKAKRIYYTMRGFRLGRTIKSKSRMGKTIYKFKLY